MRAGRRIGSRIRRGLERLLSWAGIATLEDVRRESDRIRLALGGRESRRVRRASFASIHEAEFSVFSQWGEDGIIQYLLGRVPVERAFFVELGVGDYSESNTRFLLCHDDWPGLIVDAGTDHQEFVRRRGLDWRHRLRACSALLTPGNVEAVLRAGGASGDIGLLSLDLDGIDFWVLDAIRAVSPRILVAEYNGVFGAEKAVTVPFRPDFDRTRAHFSNLYFGASIAALCRLLERRGYVFVGCTSAGNDAFFVRRDVAGRVEPMTAQQGYVEPRFSESRDRRGALTGLGAPREKLEAIADLPLFVLDESATRPVREVYGL